MSTKLIKLTSVGDTIVEVLLAITVISLILAGAYVTTNHSLLAERASQERENALKLTESQIEQLKSVAAVNAPSLFSASGSFCLIGDAISYNTACTVDINGNPNPTAVQPAFSLSIVTPDPDSTNDSDPTHTFVVTTSWASLVQTANDVVTIKYRIHQQ